MTDETSADPHDLNTYFIIRDLGSELAGTFDAVNFEPLFQLHPETLSIAALLPGNHLAGQQDIWLTLWRGYRDGFGQDGSTLQMWLKTEVVNARGTDDMIQSVAPGETGLGLDFPDTGDREDLVPGVEALTRLLAVALPVHRTQSDPGLAFAALNGALHEGLHGEAEPDAAGLVEELEELCAECDLDAVEFGPRDDSDEFSFAASTVLDLADPVRLQVWVSDDGEVWIDVGGRIQRMDSTVVEFPGEDEQEAQMVAGLALQLADIHDVAESIFTSMDPGDPDPAFELLNAVAYAAMNRVRDLGPDARPWHRLADLFGDHCRLGFLAGVMLEESPFGNLNIRATTLDPATKSTTDLQVYWKQDDEKDIPEHWLSVGTATGPAHDVDPEYPELLADLPEVGREYIRHAIDHLHQMVHLAGSVLEAKTHEALHFLEARRTVEDVPDAIELEMVRGTIDDTIAGLNGIALLYTGAMPSD